MVSRATMACGIAAAAIMASACSGSSARVDGGSTSSSSGGASAAVTFSCTTPDLCTEALAPPSAMAGEEQACMTEKGTFGTGCSTKGVFGCCVHGVITQCSYSANQAAVGQDLCAREGGIWSTADGGSAASGAAAFVGTWARAGTQTITCPTGSPRTNMLTGKLVIALGSAAGSIVGTQPNGCVTNYTVSGDVATAAAGQTCKVSADAGSETVTVVTHTLTLSAGGLTLTSAGNETIDETATMTMCTSKSSGVYTKM
jgi:hypothetical protein